MLLLLRNRHIFREHRPEGIYTIGGIVSHVVLMIINSETHFRSVSTYDINEQWRLIHHIDDVVGTDDSKKRCRIQRSLEATTSRMIVGCLMPPV
jgi:AAA+ superfamily predicted ATPase